LQHQFEAVLADARKQQFQIIEKTETLLFLFQFDYPIVDVRKVIDTWPYPPLRHPQNREDGVKLIQVVVAWEKWSVQQQLTKDTRTRPHIN